ncbi:unnamed protein product [Microthlaspi erraticum]|nr:unnamed protein product [Microthlaspi erraticum]
MWPMELRRSFPWVIWRLWTNRNLLLFDGKPFDPGILVEKIKSDVEEWFLAQTVIEEETKVLARDLVDQNVAGEVISSVLWKAPPKFWVKCNVGVSWSKRNKLAGASWVTRDDKGLVLLHSRTTLVNLKSAEEGSFLALCWAMESMASHRFQRVIFEVEDVILVGVVNRPQAWPSFGFEASEILLLLSDFVDWKVVKGGMESNRGANLIAQSVTNDGRFHSYVASHHPLWLNGVFESERVSSSS